MPVQQLVKRAAALVRGVAAFWRGFLQDARYGARMLARTPGSTLAAVICLAIGIGTVVATFTQVRSTVFRPIPGVDQPGGLVRLHKPVAFSDVQELRERSDQFTSLAAYMAPVPVGLSQPGAEPERVWGHLATPDYFDVLRAKAALGRFFGAEERRQGAGQAAVLSYRLWRARFGGDPSIVGRTITVNGQPVTVLGVASPDFRGASPLTSAADIWIPTTAPAEVAPELRNLQTSRAAAFDAIGRLKPGITYSQAEIALDSFLRRLERMHGDAANDSRERRVRLLPGGRMFALRDEDLPRAMGFPLLLVSLVLLMACGNVANMSLAKSASRRREIAIRLAVGARRGRILRQLLTESALLAALGGAGGLVLAFWAISAMESLKPLMPGYVSYQSRFDWQSLTFAMLVAAGCGLFFGVVPALRASGAGVSAGLKCDARAQLRAPRWFSLRNVLVFQQVVVSMVLLLLTGFIVLGWQRSTGVDVGYKTANLYVASIDPVRDGYTAARAQDFFEKLPSRLARIPGIENVSLAQTLPLGMASGEALMNAKIEFAEGARSLAAMRVDRVGAGFFETAGIALLRGREFIERDQADDSRALIVNETAAERVWPGEDAVGETMELEGETWQVIGVVRDVRLALPLAPPQAAVYRPVTPSGFAAPARHGVTVMLRATPGFDLPARLRREIAAIDPNVSVFQVRRISDEVDRMLYLARFGSIIYGGMGLFGMILASVGLAGVTAYAVARRTHEIGIRVALGARAGNVLWLVLREGAGIVAAGTVAGLGIALAATRALSYMVETVAETTRTSASDPLLLIGAPVLLAGLALMACYVPARRSTRIDPVAALRAE